MTRRDLIALKNLSPIVALLKKIDREKGETYASLFHRVMDFIVPAEHQPKIMYFIWKYSNPKMGEEAWLNNHKKKIDLIHDLEKLIQLNCQRVKSN